MNITIQAQQLQYRLSKLMPTIHQNRTFQAFVLALLNPHRSSLPEHNPLRSSSSISRFLNRYIWPTRMLLRLTRQVLLGWLLEASKRGRHPYLKVIIDLTCLEKRGRFLGLGGWINAMNGKVGVQLVMMYLEIGRVRVPWNFRIWKGKGSASPMTLSLRMLSSLPALLTDRCRVMVLADAWFASNDFIEGVHARGLQAVLGIREDRRTVEDKPLTRLRRKGTRVMLKGLSIPVWVSWFYLRFENGDREKRFVISTAPVAGSLLVRLGRFRWKIEAFFKTIKHSFSLAKAAQGTCLGMLRYLLLSLLAFVLAFASEPVPPPGEVLPWGEMAQQAALLFLPGMLVWVLLAEVEKRRCLLESLGMSVHIHRFRHPAHNCKI
jgi:hypothetical protein